MTRSDIWGPESVKQCVAAGLGLSLISEHAVVDDVRWESLAVLAVSPRPRSRPVDLVCRRDRLRSPAERTFMGVLRMIGSWPRELSAR
ncbi:LysR substrate-binding domain-containing protein [Streptomyces atratus]|uniref:LysR substrate-binding domain-containing protein n=1 Tax=Streptomyces atratus TaxID=1893 RepID=UPI0032554365